MSELFALRKSHKRTATAEEVETARPFYAKGNVARGSKGILFIHGFTVTPASFKGFAESLAADGYTVSVPLLPGHAGRPTDLNEVRWDQWLDTVLVAYDKLREECEEVFVVGLSLGGALGLQLATRRDDIRKLFLLAPAVYPTPLLKLAVRSLLPLLRKLGFQYWKHVAGDVKREDGFELGYGKTSINGLMALNACMESTQKILPDVTADVLIFQGRADHEVQARKAKEILNCLGSSQKDLIWLDNSFHEIPRDHESQLVLDTIREQIAAPG